MGYKPKYAQKGRKKPEIIRGDVPQPQAPVEKKKKSKWVVALFVLLGLVIIPASTFVSYKLLGEMALNLGRPREANLDIIASKDVMSEFEEKIGGKMTAIRRNLGSGEAPEIPEAETVPAETEPVARPLYWLDDDTLVAPEPDQSKFGTVSSPSKIEELLKEAEWILDGQKTYLQPSQELYEGSQVRYYLDDSIFAVTWQEVHDGSVYTFSEVKVRHASQFRRHLAGGEYGSDTQYLTTEMAEAVNAVVASAGDFYRFRDFGAVVYKGEAKRVEGTYAETCYIDRNGDLHFTYGGDVLKVADVQEFVDEHDIWFSLAFGPVLVQDYQEVEHTWYGVGEINEGYARAALLQMGELHYIVVAANTTGAYQNIPTVAQFRKNIVATGCKHAYCLDGGQTATIVMNDELINRPVYGTQRKISDIIYFATAVPEGGTENG